MNNLQVAPENLKKHFFSFFPSLEQYPEKYLSLIFEDTTDIPKHMAYLCPMCLKNYIFYITTQLRWTETFSLDHFPPDEVAGKSTLLVCKPCNNNAGSSYESKFGELTEKECFNKKIPNSKINTNVTFTNVRGWHKGKLGIDESGQYSFDLATKQTKNLPELATWKNQSSGDWEMNMTIKHQDETKFVKSLLKSTYLYCFNHWGYNFAFSNSGSLMRQVLKGESNYPIKIPSLWLDDKSQGIELANISTGPVFISEPKELQSIFINIPIELKHLGYKCIIPIQIPNPTKGSVEEMQRINQSILTKKLVTIEMAPIDFPDRGMKNSFLHTWNSLLQQFN